MEFQESNYPKDYKNFKEVYGYGGIRIYQVSEDQGNEIAKEFPKSFRSKPPFATPIMKDEQLFYMNINHGEQHFIFSVPIH